MRKLVIMLSLAAISLNGFAQKSKIKTAPVKTAVEAKKIKKHDKLEVGIMGGSSVYTGDIHCEKFFLKQINAGGGIFARYYFSDKFTTRVNLQAGQINGNDVNYGTQDHIRRGFTFKSLILDGDLLLEYEPFAGRRFRGGEFHRILSPYVNTGVSYLYSMPTTNYNEVNNDFLKTQIAADKANMKFGHIALPLTAGLRYDLGRRLTLGAEATFRLPFSDYLDGVSQAGNPNKNDWYYTANILLGYKFGQAKESKINKNAKIADRDNDGIADNIDSCPDEIGLRANNGCPKTEEEIADEAAKIEEVKAPEPTKEKLVGTQTAGEKVKGTQTTGEKIVGTQTTGEKVKGTQTVGEKVKGSQTMSEKTIVSTNTAPTQTASSTTKTTTAPSYTAPSQVLSANTVVDYSSVRIEAPGAYTARGGNTNTGNPNQQSIYTNKNQGSSTGFSAPSYNTISAESSAVLREAMFGILFETDSDRIKKESSVILNKLYKTVASGNEHITISGHTDTQGCPADNQKLSEARAFSVYKYLIGKGIPSNRISYEGLGDTQPLEDNCSIKSRSKNRRVEFRIQ